MASHSRSGIAAWKRTVIACARNAAIENRPTDIALPAEKRAARSLEREGIVSVERTSERFAGLVVWKVRLVVETTGVEIEAA